MSATITAIFSDPIRSSAALEALRDAGFVERVDVWSTSQPQPTVEVRGARTAVDLATTILRAHEPVLLGEDCHSLPLRGYDVDSSAHTQNAKTAAEQWRARRAEAASTPEAWAATRRQIRFGGLRTGRSAFNGATTALRGNSLRDRRVSVRDDQGPHTLTSRK